MFRSTKTYDHNIGLSACFRQFRATSHCRFLHGYALAFRFEFEALELDQNGWVIDFGSLKPLKEGLEYWFDHKTLVHKDDPHLEWFRQGMVLGTCDIHVVGGMGVEYFAQEAARLATDLLAAMGESDRVRVAKVEVREHAGNSAIWEAGEWLFPKD